MLAGLLRAGGRRTAALGNIGEPLVEATDYDVLAGELSSFQLYWSRDLAVPVGALLNLAEDHLGWHGTLDAHAHAKEAVWRGGGTAVGKLADALLAGVLAQGA